jgi:hypothetical protein
MVADALFVTSATLVAVTVTTPANVGATKVALVMLCALKDPLEVDHVTPALPMSFVTAAVNGSAWVTVSPPRFGLIATLMFATITV